jgi:electron transfer flavoprotein alpha subunit
LVAGSGLGGHETVDRMAEAARHMGADFGVSRPVAMNGWASTDRLIGASGTRTAPAVCIVAGVSGAPAFYWGIEKADFIVAVNPDERAPLVRKADVVLLDDGLAVVKELAKIMAAPPH